jgi:hypothetical protein
MSIGGRMGYDDDGETPNTQVVYHDYEKAPLIFETRGLPKSKEFHAPSLWGKNMDSPQWFPGGGGVSVMVDCEGGKVYDGLGGVAAYDHSGNKIQTFQGEPGRPSHMQNFIDAVREKKSELLASECLETHLSSALCETGMISHFLGKPMPEGEIRERVKGDRLAEDRFEAMKEHLVRNGMSLADSLVTLGPWLDFDPKKERFVKNERANALLTRQYRKGFEVPEKV